jgi:hypothetical protein
LSLPDSIRGSPGEAASVARIKHRKNRRFAKDFHGRICQLTQQIIREQMEIVIDCETISKPIVRKPICTRPCFRIATSDLAEASAFA